MLQSTVLQVSARRDSLLKKRAEGSERKQFSGAVGRFFENIL
jgi:hypothetical protein